MAKGKGKAKANDGSSDSYKPTQRRQLNVEAERRKMPPRDCKIRPSQQNANALSPVLEQTRHLREVFNRSNIPPPELEQPQQLRERVNRGNISPPAPEQPRQLRERVNRGQLLAGYSDEESDSDDISEESYDVKDNPGIKGVISKDDYRMWRNSAYFIRSASGLADLGWVGKRPLGQGSFGLAGLWEKRDADGRVIDQMVIKQIGAYKTAPWDKNMPNEVKIMRKMNLTNCSGVVRLITYKRYPRQQVHRIYMEFCPYGDLARLCQRYRRFGRYFPEFFLWEVFYYLVEAATAMRFGPDEEDEDDGDDDDEKWNFDCEIVHRDIKPGNIFLGDEDKEDGVPFYPTAKLGDFGLAVETNSSDPHNPETYRNEGTVAYMAPEQFNVSQDELKAERSGKRPTRRILSPTNIYAIGATMFEILTLEHASDWLNKDEGLNRPGRQKMCEVNNSAYSHELIDLILRCLEVTLRKRIDVEKLRLAIKKQRDKINERYAEKDEPDENDRVYYRGNEINDMAAGKFLHGKRKIQDPKKQESGYRNPSLSPVRFPYLGSIAYEIDGPEGHARRRQDETVEIHIDDEEKDSDVDTQAAAYARYLGRRRTESQRTGDVRRVARKQPARAPLRELSIIGPEMSRAIEPSDEGSEEEDAEDRNEDGEEGHAAEEDAGDADRDEANEEGEAAEKEASNPGTQERNKNVMALAGSAMRRLSGDWSARQERENEVGQEDEPEGEVRSQQSEQRGENKEAEQGAKQPKEHQGSTHSNESGSKAKNKTTASTATQGTVSEPPHTGNFRQKRRRLSAHEESEERGHSPSTSEKSQDLQETSSEPPHTGIFRHKRRINSANEGPEAQSHSSDSNDQNGDISETSSSAPHDGNFRNKRRRVEPSASPSHSNSLSQRQSQDPSTNTNTNADANETNPHGSASPARPTQGPRNVKARRPRRGWGPREEWS